VPNEQIIGHDAGDQIVAMLLGVAEEIEVADVEEVESAPERSRCESWLSLLFSNTVKKPTPVIAARRSGSCF
jgi:hypothetical protein